MTQKRGSGVSSSKRGSQGDQDIRFYALDKGGSKGRSGTTKGASFAKRIAASWKSVLLIIGLTLLSWISTYTGMLELISANAGEISTLIIIAVAFAVAILQLMILFVLDQVFSKEFYARGSVIAIFPLYLAGYLFLTLISVGFGFGFYWKYLEARTEATASAESSVGQVQSLLERGQSQIGQLEATLGTLATISAARAETERERGGTCPGSGPGAGPRMRLREADASRFAFANQFVATRAATVQQEIATLNGQLARLIANDPATIDQASSTRNVFMRELNRDMRLTAARFNALRTDPQLLALRDELAARAEQTVFASDGASFRCPDPALSSALNGVVRAIDELPVLEPPEIAPVEGAAAVVEAFRRLTTTVYGLIQMDLPPTPEALRLERDRAASAGVDMSNIPQAASGLGARDFIPLAIAIFVDFCILLVSMNRPLNAFRSFYGSVDDARKQEMGDFMTIFKQVFTDQFNEKPTPNLLFSPIQDVVFDHRGHYYAAVPLVSGRGMNDAHIHKAAQARYIASIFLALETRGFVKLIRRDRQAAKRPQFDNGQDRPRMFGRLTRRGWDDLSSFAREQLSARGSEFADAQDFRLYRFSTGQWPEIVLRTVVSAHQEEVAHLKNEGPRISAPEGETRRAIEDKREQDRGELRSSASEAPSGQLPPAERTAPMKLITKDAGQDGTASDDDFVADDDPDTDTYNEVLAERGQAGSQPPSAGAKSAQRDERERDERTPARSPGKDRRDGDERET
jgi:hypothetical protein